MLSIIIPTYNRKELLHDCLSQLEPSIQQFDPKEYEVIVTDDSGNNDTRQMLLNQHKRIQWVAGPQRGPAANRNNGAKHAKGEWLLFLDDDCMPDINILSNYKKAIDDNPKVEIIEGLIFSDEFIKPLFTAPTNLTGGNLWSCNFAIQKNIFEKIDGFDEHYKFPHLEDNDLHRRVVQKYNMIFVKDAKVYHPQRPVASPRKLATYHESWFYFYNKFGEKKTLINLLVSITKARLASIKKKPFNIMSLKAITHLVAELFFTAKNSRGWKK